MRSAAKTWVRITSSGIKVAATAPTTDFVDPGFMVPLLEVMHSSTGPKHQRSPLWGFRLFSYDDIHGNI